MNQKIRTIPRLLGSIPRVLQIYTPIFFLLLSGIGIQSAQADMSVSIFPENSCAQLGENCTVYFYVDSLGSTFNGYDVWIEFDPAMLEFVSVQEESVMINGAGQRWWQPEIFSDRVHLSHTLLAAGASATGPGPLSSIKFNASPSLGITEVNIESVEFYYGPYIIDDVGSHNGTIFISTDCSLTACCLSDDSCQLAAEEDCLTLGGVHLPSVFTCDPDPCFLLDTYDEGARDQTGLNLICPNPVVGIIDLRYSLDSPGIMSIAIFDPTGRLVINLLDGQAQAGQSQTSWNGLDQAGRPVQAGTYFCRLAQNNRSIVRPLIVLE